MTGDKFIIYAAYGSNMLKKRFMVYINGGTFKGISHRGCNDKTETEDLGWQRVPYRLYFARQSQGWGQKAIAFLTSYEEPRSDYQAVVRLWKVRESQFNEIKEQEGSWHDKILELGEKDGFLIKTVTGDHEDDIREPSDSYLEVIRSGLEETTGWDKSKIEEYLNRFLKKQG